ncbi:MAG: hypothetical protein ACKVYV_04440 [Limisphaerales bacterium]
MNPLPDEPLEKLLRAAPTPPPPPGLRSALEREIPRTASAVPGRAVVRPGWWGQWWPVLAAACVAVGCFVVAGVQSARLAELRRAVEQLRAQPAGVAAAAPAPAAPARDPRAEIVELRTRLASLEAELAAATAPAAQAGTATVAVDAAEEAAFREAAEKMAEARGRAQSIRCVNSLKQLGLAARVWATDNGDVAPSTWLQMTNEMVTPKILVCPSDTTRSAAADWGGFGPANVSYDFVTPNALETEPQVVLFRCPIHGHVCLADGSVQHGVAKTHPEGFRMVNGRLIFDGGPPSAPTRKVAGAPQPGTAGMSPVLLRRYGLMPPEGAVVTDVQPDEGAAVTYTMSEELMRRYGLLPPTNAAVIIGSGEVPGEGTFDVILEVTEPVPEREAPPEQP